MIEKQKYEDGEFDPEAFQPKECPNCRSRDLEWGYVLDAHFIVDLSKIPYLMGDKYKEASAIRALHCTQCDHLLGFYVSRKDKQRIDIALGIRSFIANLFTLTMILGFILVVIIAFFAIISN